MYALIYSSTMLSVGLFFGHMTILPGNSNRQLHIKQTTIPLIVMKQHYHPRLLPHYGLNYSFQITHKTHEIFQGEATAFVRPLYRSLHTIIQISASKTMPTCYHWGAISSWM